MANPYFRNIPDFEYINRTKDGQFISNYTQVKNFFKKGKPYETINLVRNTDTLVFSLTHS